MKNDKKNIGCLILLGIIILIAAIAGIKSVVSCIGEKSYDAKIRKGIVSYTQNENAVGTKVVAYDETKKIFTDRFIPKELRASNAKEVGYILYYTDKQLSVTERYGISQYSYSSGKSITGKVEQVTVRLVNYKTGREVATTTFTASAPSKSVQKRRLSMKKSLRPALNPG